MKKLLQRVFLPNYTVRIASAFLLADMGMFALFAAIGWFVGLIFPGTSLIITTIALIRAIYRTPITPKVD
jgi:hypothetical protein